jgi:heptosyltransferase-2
MLDLGGAFLRTGPFEGALPDPAFPACDAILPALVPAGPPVIALAPGTTYGEAKTWPLDRAAEFLCEALAGNRNRVVLLGDAQARPLAEALAGKVGMATESTLEKGGALTDLTGRTDLTRVAAVLKSCRGFVGNDSGLMHLAAALGVPTVGIFGSSNPDWTAPRGKRTVAVAAEGYPCRPCYRRNCNQPRFCLEDIGGGRVMEVLTDLMGREVEEAAP